MNAVKSPPRVMAIHDLSGIGKCSLTVILPILSAMGMEVAALPTALLSTHTGDIKGYTYRDLTEDMMPIAEHWRSLDIAFRALYSGWLGSPAQSHIVERIFDLFHAPGTLRVVDPVMGDHGKLYSTYTPDRVADMRTLLAKADLITPNLTEAHFLLSMPYTHEPMDRDGMRTLCRRLTALGPSQIVVSGISTSEQTIGAAAYDAKSDTLSVHERPLVAGKWHGTGDIFCSVLLGDLLSNKALDHATAHAVRFTQECIARTQAQGTDPRFGVDFEHGLPALMTK